MTGVLCMMVGAGWGPFEIDIPGTISGNSSSSPVTANGSVSSITGGTGDYTYSWTWDSPGSPVSISITNADTATPTFSANLAASQETSGTVRCTVTDVTTGRTASDTALVTLTRN